jgi:hypothetical protein
VESVAEWSAELGLVGAMKLRETLKAYVLLLESDGILLGVGGRSTTITGDIMPRSVGQLTIAIALARWLALLTVYCDV